MKDSLWEGVIGLEIHVRLSTKTKLFSRAPNRFGNEPNTNITDVCTGQPGTLPVLNREAVRKAVLLGCAVGATISPRSGFDRKSYFYPDSPRNYQITQFEHPLFSGGSIEATVDGETKIFPINRAHLEDDSGMLKHFSTFTGIDYNRAGSPLIEIVSEPCFRSGKEAAAYAEAVRLLMLYLDASDGNMEEGSLRMDANISVRQKGETGLRTKIEIKNMNSFRNMQEAIDTEISRQIAIYTANPDKDPKTVLSQGTYRFDPETGSISLMRSKENAEDYRYCPEPDLQPIVLRPETIERIRNSLPELPRAKSRRYRSELDLPESSIEAIISDKPLCEYFERALRDCKNPKSLANWILTEFTGRLKESGRSLPDSGILPEHIGELVTLIEEGTVTGKIAKSIADDMVMSPGLSPITIGRNNPDYLPISDVSSVEPVVDAVLSENRQSILDYRSGKQRAYGFLVGQVMKATQGKASPSVVNELLTKKLQDIGDL